MGMRPIVVDSGDKKDLCMKSGAEEFVDFKEHKDVGARVREIAGGIGAHGVVVTAYQAYKGKVVRYTLNFG
jgi:propanol-preferring alcohol dehydrogenase